MEPNSGEQRPSEHTVYKNVCVIKFIITLYGH